MFAERGNPSQLRNPVTLQKIRGKNNVSFYLDVPSCFSPSHQAVRRRWKFAALVENQLDYFSQGTLVTPYRLDVLEGRLARSTSLPAFSLEPAAYIQATPSTSASASSSTTPIVSVPFVAQEEHGTVLVNTVLDVTTALQPLLMTQELRRLMPQPKFSGDRLTWKDFEAE